MVWWSLALVAVMVGMVLCLLRERIRAGYWGSMCVHHKLPAGRCYLCSEARIAILEESLVHTQRSLADAEDRLERASRRITEGTSQADLH